MNEYNPNNPLYPPNPPQPSTPPSYSRPIPNPSSPPPPTNIPPAYQPPISYPTSPVFNNIDPKPPKKRKWLRNLLITILFLLIIIALVVWLLMPASSSNTSSSISSTTTSNFAIQPNAGNALSADQIYEKAIPSVVGIQTYGSKTKVTDSMLGEGSGVILSEDGYIVTNAHVVSSGEEKAIMVILHDGTSYEATLIGADEYMDLAVLKVNGTNLTAAEFGDSTALKIGYKCYAIGNPGGVQFAGSMTDGMISGLDRQLMDDSGFITPSIQTNAAINPGNSGGALVNDSGQVIGITSSKLAGDYFEAMGFAIPINEAQPIIEELISNGKVTGRPRIGISYKQSAIIGEATAELYGIPTGIMVDSVDSSSDAAAKGVKAGDIIHSIDGETISSVNDVQRILKNYKAGQTITVEIYRPKSSTSLENGETLTISFELMEQKDS